MDKTILSVLADSPQLLEAVRQKFYAKFSLDGIDLADRSEKELGEMAKAVLCGKKMLGEVFAEIEIYKTIKVDDKGEMPAR